MSSNMVKEEKDSKIPSMSNFKGEFEFIVGQMKVSFSKVISIKRAPDIYNGKEKLSFAQRHPIFKSIMRIEFEEAMKAFLHRRK